MDRRRFVAAMGGVLAAPLVRAQRAAKVVRIGVLAQVFAPQSDFWKPLFAAPHDRGWRVGDNFTLEVRESHGDPVRALAMAKELVAHRVDLLLAISGAAAVAAKRATDQVPIVGWVGYPVEAGLAKSLARPGGNVTGVANYASDGIWGKLVVSLKTARAIGLTIPQSVLLRADRVIE